MHTVDAESNNVLLSMRKVKSDMPWSSVDDDPFKVTFLVNRAFADGESIVAFGWSLMLTTAVSYER